ncbi:hypothetical protein [Priestia megaterium]|uniref:hypothetical protein n=1 Tax=Priestia megaterium TaxID=1404 RepID=UPI001A944169|nr:hypothetical protein [Priestia megaterium]QSX23444.1 hypothetical protein J0P05_27085 [Priestia megaterium]
MIKKSFLRKLFVTAFSTSLIFTVGNTALADTTVESTSAEANQEVTFESYNYSLKSSMQQGGIQSQGTMSVQAAGSTYPYGKYTGYDFGKTSFSNYVWIKGGGTFKNLATIDMENSTGQSISVQVYDSTGKYYGKGVTAKGAGWRSVNFEAAGILPKGKYYKIKLVNLGSGTVTLKQGTVLYNY